MTEPSTVPYQFVTRTRIGKKKGKTGKEKGDNVGKVVGKKYRYNVM
jgi:hypothetical protein